MLLTKEKGIRHRWAAKASLELLLIFVRILLHAQTKKNDTYLRMCHFSWLGWRDSNPRMPGPKPGALPLGHIPIMFQSIW